MLQYNVPDNLLPYKTEIKIPNTVKSIFEFQSENNKNGLIEIPLKTNGLIALNILNQQYYCQFYLDLTYNERHRDFEYFFESNTNLLDFHIVLQKPLGATRYESSLVEPEEFNDEYNLTYNRKLISELDKNEKLKITFSYDKESSLTTLQILDKILTDHNHNEKDEHNHQNIENDKVNNKLLNNYNKAKYYSISFGFLLIMILLLIFILSNSKFKRNYINKINYCSNCENNLNMDLNSKYCVNCGEKINVS
jgi:hypothetical protein